MKRYIMIIALLLGAVLAVGCNKVEPETVTDPLDGTIWTRTSFNSLSKQEVIYYLEFSAGTVCRWNTENSLSGSGRYAVDGSKVTFTDFSVPIIWGGSIKNYYRSAVFTATSITLHYDDGEGYESQETMIKQ